MRDWVGIFFGLLFLLMLSGILCWIVNMEILNYRIKQTILKRLEANLPVVTYEKTPNCSIPLMVNAAASRRASQTR